jgi:AcrR family transcriptional regulator
VNIEQSIQISNHASVTAEIIAVARVRFLRFGYVKTSMQEIADDCRMSPANLYRYFEGKPAIAAAVALAEQKMQLAECDEAVRTARDNVTDRLIALFQTIIDSSRHRMRHKPLLFDLALQVARETPALRRDFLNEIEARIRMILENEGMRSSAAEPAALKQKARLILTACAPFVLPWLLLNEPFGNPRPKVAALIRCLLSGLNAQSPLTTQEIASLRD